MAKLYWIKRVLSGIFGLKEDFGVMLQTNGENTVDLVAEDT